MSEIFKAYRVEEEGDTFRGSVVSRSLGDLPDNEVLIAVKYSSLNYKDALSARGNRGVTRRYPHTPGIDAAGTVKEDRSGKFPPGTEVLVTGYDLGMNTDGGFAEMVRVPADWIVKRPENLSLRESMIYGTAGFTAGLALHKMQLNGQFPEKGKILVTGASGGVGTLACALLALTGYRVMAATGKNEAKEHLMKLGVAEILTREEVDDRSGKPLIRSRWAGAIDNVGGNILSTAVKGCMKHGNIAVIGNARSAEWEATVYPFILNGVNLLGVDSATTEMKTRRQIWDKLSKEWRLGFLDELADEITLEQLDIYIDKILRSEVTGRVIIRL